MQRLPLVMPLGPEDCKLYIVSCGCSVCKHQCFSVVGPGPVASRVTGATGAAPHALPLSELVELTLLIL